MTNLNQMPVGELVSKTAHAMQCSIRDMFLTLAKEQGFTNHEDVGRMRYNEWLKNDTLPDYLRHAMEVKVRWGHNPPYY